MDNIAYNCMYRNIICNRFEEYTILYYFLKGNCNGILRCTVVLLKKKIDYSVYLPLNSVKTRRVRQKLVYLWLHTFQGVNSFCRAVFLFFLICRTEPCLRMHVGWRPTEMRLTHWSQRYEACPQDRHSYRPLSCGGHFVPGDYKSFVFARLTSFLLRG